MNKLVVLITIICLTFVNIWIFLDYNNVNIKIVRTSTNDKNNRNGNNSSEMYNNKVDDSYQKSLKNASDNNNQKLKTSEKQNNDNNDIINLKNRLKNAWTIVAVPKAFTLNKETDTNQRRGILSWLALNKIAPLEIILACDERGTNDIVKEFGLKHIKHCPKSSRGSIKFVPIMKEAEKIAKGDIIMFVNSDIVLGPDFGDSLRYIINVFESRKNRNWFAFAQRYNSLELTKKPLSYYGDYNKFTVKEAEMLKRRGEFEGTLAQDIFIWPKGVFNLNGIAQDLLIGRCGFDNYLISHAMQRQPLLVIDLTPTSTLLHPTHDYKHLGNANHWTKHPDCQTNINFARGLDLMCSETSGFNGLRVFKYLNGTKYIKSNVRGKRCTGPIPQVLN